MAAPPGGLTTPPAPQKKAKKTIRVVRVGSREFLRTARWNIPIDKITQVDFAPPTNRNADAVIDTTKGEYRFLGEAAVQLREYFDAL
jgi:hypothetical protein